MTLHRIPTDTAGAAEMRWAKMNSGGPNRNVLILIILSSVAAPLAFRVAVLGGLDWLEQAVRDQLLALSLAVALLALSKETRR
jgi:hypothetical protein